MTQLSTVANDEARPSPSATLGVIASIAIALAVGVGLGLLVSNVDATSAAQETSQSPALTHEQFLRMNTEDLDHLVPTGLAVATVPPTSDPFMVRNVDSYEWLSRAVQDRHAVGSRFYEINTWDVESVASSDVSSTAPGGDIISDSEPLGHPNYGRLETYIGAQPAGGVR